MGTYCGLGTTLYFRNSDWLCDGHGGHQRDSGGDKSCVRHFELVESWWMVDGENIYQQMVGKC